MRVFIIITERRNDRASDQPTTQNGYRNLSYAFSLCW